MKFEKTKTQNVLKFFCFNSLMSMIWSKILLHIDTPDPPILPLSKIFAMSGNCRVVPWGLCKSSCSTFSFAETFPYFISIPVSRIYVLTWRLGCVKGEGGGGRGCSGLSEETRCLSRGFCSESADCWRRCGAEESRRRRRSWLTKKTFTSLRLRTEKSAGTGRLYRYNQIRWHCQIWVRSHNRTVLQART